jgi:ribosomal protein S12 methylthiotransferase
MVSLGCAKNTVDAEMALAAVLGDSFSLALDPDDADLVLINTCGFIAPARDEARAVINEFLAAKKKSGGRLKLAVMGCWAERSATELAQEFPGLDAIWGLGIFPEIASAVGRVLAAREREEAGFGVLAQPFEGPRLISTPPSYSYLKISDGCDNRCSYCSIPDIRGPFRSRPRQSIVEEARILAGRGVGELVVIGQDTTLYGDEPAGEGITRLIEEILAAVSTPRIRLLYAHPAHLSSSLINLLVSEPRLCRYLDLPLQHVSDRMLKLMNRGYGRQRVEEITSRLDVKGFTLRTTLLTGFPGEQEEDFRTAQAWVAAGFAKHLGVFAYSPEAGTPAVSFPGMVPPAEAARRRDVLLALQREKTFAWLDSRRGESEEILVDKVAEDGWLEGRTIREAPEVDGVVRLAARASPGVFLTACIQGREEYDLIAVAREGKKPLRRPAKKVRHRRS